MRLTIKITKLNSLYFVLRKIYLLNSLLRDYLISGASFYLLELISLLLLDDSLTYVIVSDS